MYFQPKCSVVEVNDRAGLQGLIFIGGVLDNNQNNPAIRSMLTKTTGNGPVHVNTTQKQHKELIEAEFSF